MFRMLAVLGFLSLATLPAQAAYIFGCGAFNRLICVDGFIETGDAQRFAAFARGYPAGTYVRLSGPGGRIAEALDIGDIIHNRGFSTSVFIRNGYCGSACAILFFSGHHAVIQNRSQLLFHEAALPNGESVPPEAYEWMTERILAWGGLNRRQITILLHLAPNSDQALATEWLARRLGIGYDVVPSMMLFWQNCPTKFCLAVP